MALRAILVLLVSAAATPAVPAHGGGLYRGPAPAQPPGVQAGGTPFPGPQGPGLPGPLTPSASTQPDVSDWSVWWSYHRDALLDLQNTVQGLGADTGDDDFFLGAGQRRGALPSARPSRAVLAQRVIPALLEVLREDRDRDLVTAAMVALAKITGPEGVPLPAEGRDRLHALLAHSSQEVAETAALALGIEGSPSNATSLAALLADDERGRELVGRARVPERTQAFAAYALATLARRSPRIDVRRYAVMQLAGPLETPRSSAHDVPVACLIGMGLVPLESTGRRAAAGRASLPATAGLEAQCAWLLARLDDRMPDAVRAQVPVALARLALRAGGPELSTAARELGSLAHPLGRAGREARRGAATALGLLGDDDLDPLDRQIRAALMRQARDGELLERHLALISLARNAGRKGNGADAGGGARETRAYLRGQLVRGRSTTRPWAALALALLERAREEPEAASAVALVTSGLAGTRSPRNVGAFSVALGLLGDPDSAQHLLGRLDSGDLDVRGHAAVGLGLLGSRDALEPLRELAREATYRPGLLRDAATGLGLLGDRALVPELLDRLAHAGSLASQSALAVALGRVGDARAVEPLVSLLGDHGSTTGARAFAAAALGIVCDKEPLPWNVPLGLDVEYGLPPATLVDPLGARGVLDLL